MRGNQIDIKWYNKDFSNSTQVQLTISDKSFQGIMGEIDNILSIMYQSLDKVNYAYAIYHISSKTYDIYVKYMKPIKDFKKARIRHSLYVLKPESTYTLVNRKNNIQDMKTYLLKLSTDPDVLYINPIKPIKNFIIPNKQLKSQTNCSTSKISESKSSFRTMYTNISKNILNDLLNGDIKSGIYLIDSNQGHYKIGSSADVLGRLQTHNTSLAIINIHLIIYTTRYRLLEKVLLTNLDEYKLHTTKEFINGDKITLEKLIDSIIHCTDMLKIKHTIFKSS
jgi:hypothetical protein